MSIFKYVVLPYVQKIVRRSINALNKLCQLLLRCVHCGDSGSGTILGIGVIGVVVTLLIAIAVMMSVVQFRSALQSRADNIALVAMQDYWVGTDGCRRAIGTIGDSETYHLKSCSYQNRQTDVVMSGRIEVPILHWYVMEVKSRAGVLMCDQ